MVCGDFTSTTLGIAFACTIGAGLATVIGSLAIVITPLRDPRWVAGALAFSAGVLLYVSIVDIYIAKAVGAFAEVGGVIQSNSTHYKHKHIALHALSAL